MRSFRTSGKLVMSAVLCALVGGPAFAVAASANPTVVAPATVGVGSTNEFGKTNNFDEGNLTQDIYTHTWYCDTSVAAKSTTGCEAGASFKKPPSSQYDPLYITVPLGFNVPAMQCPQGLVCVDHPGTIDLSALGGPVNAMTPGHDHFTTTTFGGAPEWWNVVVVGVTNPATFNAITAHRSYAYIESLRKAGNKSVTGDIPTNLFLYFAVRPVGSGY